MPVGCEPWPRNQEEFIALEKLCISLLLGRDVPHTALISDTGAHQKPRPTTGVQLLNRTKQEWASPSTTSSTRRLSKADIHPYFHTLLEKAAKLLSRNNSIIDLRNQCLSSLGLSEGGASTATTHQPSSPKFELKIAGSQCIAAFQGPPPEPVGASSVSFKRKLENPGEGRAKKRRKLTGNKPFDPPKQIPAPPSPKSNSRDTTHKDAVGSLIGPSVLGVTEFTMPLPSIPLCFKPDPLCPTATHPVPPSSHTQYSYVSGMPECFVHGVSMSSNSYNNPSVSNENIAGHPPDVTYLSNEYQSGAAEAVSLVPGYAAPERGYSPQLKPLSPRSLAELLIHFDPPPPTVDTGEEGFVHLLREEVEAREGALEALQAQGPFDLESYFMETFGFDGLTAPVFNQAESGSLTEKFSCNEVLVNKIDQ